MKRLALVMLLGISTPVSAVENPTCSLATQKCEFPSGPTVLVSSKVFPEGLGVEVMVFLNSSDMEVETALVFAEGFAQEVMAYKRWCLNGYTKVAATGAVGVARQTLICK